MNLFIFYFQSNGDEVDIEVIGLQGIPEQRCVVCDMIVQETELNLGDLV